MRRLVAALAQPNATCFEELIAGSEMDMVTELEALERLRRSEADPYRRIRACAWLAAACRFKLQDSDRLPHGAPPDGTAWHLRLSRRFETALERLWEDLHRRGIGRNLVSELGAAYHGLQYAELAGLVRQAVRSSAGSRWLFRCGSLLEYPLRCVNTMTRRDAESDQYPILVERTPVRLDFSHSGWSDIFFLAMENPYSARVVNAAVDLAFDDGPPSPPCTARVRVIDEPVIRLTSIDLGATVDCRTLEQVFDWAADHLGLLKAALVASGIVPPALEGTCQELDHLLRVLLGEGHGLELTTWVDRIPKGSRLAVSTNLLACAITALMRATAQAPLEGPLDEDLRRVVAARAILGEWLGGSGGGWQDSGGLWPGIKMIKGEPAEPGDPEFGASPGRLLPRHHPLQLDAGAKARIEASLVTFHGGMSGNVGPVLELVTSQRLVGWRREVAARNALHRSYDAVVTALRAGDCRALGAATEAAFRGPLREIIPGVSNAYVDDLVDCARQRWGDRFWGFCMLGGMAGGGMAMFVDPAIRADVDESWPTILAQAVERHRDGLDFVTEPRLLRVAIDEIGTRAELTTGQAAVMPSGYYNIHAPLMTRMRGESLAAGRRHDLLVFLDGENHGRAVNDRMLTGMVHNLLPDPPRLHRNRRETEDLSALDEERQAHLVNEYRAERISLLHNRIPAHARIEDPDDRVVRRLGEASATARDRAERLLARGRVATVTLAGGVGSRWSGGAGVIKPLAPVAEFAGRWRSFLELHLHGSRHRRANGHPGCHVVATGYQTDAAVCRALERWRIDDPDLVEDVVVSRGAVVNHRVIPNPIDLRRWLEEMPRPRLDEQAEVARANRDRAWMRWAAELGGGSRYTDNTVTQRINPPGHFWELPSLLLNGTLARILKREPDLEFLFVHNIDTLAAEPQVEPLATFLESGADFGVEVIERLSGDAGGSLALVDGRPRLVEGLAIPAEELELGLRYYNSNSWWIPVDRLLDVCGLTRERLADLAAVRAGVASLARRLPTYVTLKQVLRHWGSGHADAFPVAQFEQLWGDVTILTDRTTAFLLVPRRRGQQLKEPGQLPAWQMDGSAEEVAQRCGMA